MRRYPLQWAIVFGLAPGMAVMALVSKATDRFGRWPDELSAALGFWSVLSGTIVGLVAFGGAFAVFRRHAQLHPVRSEGSLRLSRALLLMAAPVMVLVGLSFLSHNIAWGLPLWTLEGAWLWPSAIVPLILAYFLFRRAGRIARYLEGLPNLSEDAS